MNEGAHNAMDVAAAALSCSVSPVSVFRLSKMLYFLQGLHLAKYDKPLFRESICAWTNGPCVPDVFSRFSHYGCYDLRPLLCYMDYESIETNEDFVLGVCRELDKYSSSQLMNMSRNKDMPWSVVWNNGAGRFAEIPTLLMKRLFKERIKQL